MANSASLERAVGLLLAIVAVSACSSAAVSTRVSSQPEARVRQAPKLPMPQVRVVYPAAGTMLDRSCNALLAARDVKPEWIGRAAGLAPRFQREWAERGTPLLRIVLDEVGLPFPAEEVQAYPTVCGVPNMSSPVLINVRSYVDSSGVEPPPGDFAEKLFHELMHSYVAPVFSSSPLRSKYAHERPATVAHLHVMALEVLALTRTGDADELKYVDMQYRVNPAPLDYKRAWEIVNDIEGYMAFVSELESLRPH